MRTIDEKLLATDNPSLRLRVGADSDAGLIFELITALSEYEKLAHEVETDVEGLRRSLFGNHQVAEVVIAEYLDQPAGFALFFHNFSTFLGRPGLYLEDLFVKPELRGRGIGKELLSCLARIAVARDCGRFEWSVLDWNESAIRFYENLGARPMKGWTVFRVTGESLNSLAGKA